MNFSVEAPSRLVAVQFLLVELRTGLTMTRIALASRDMSKRNRTRAHARRAYDSVLRFMPRLDPESTQVKEVEKPLAQLKLQLHLLGEQV
jgi:hypothetical protein